MTDHNRTPTDVPLRLLASVLALAGGVAAVIVAIILIRGVLG